jgi:hypothetical protein
VGAGSGMGFERASPGPPLLSMKAKDRKVLGDVTIWHSA